ncbi:MAG: response regulator transcription factor [Anaerolineales bacterium]
MSLETALLIDDNPTFLSIVRQFMESRAQFEGIVTAPSGSEGLSRARELQPDLVLLDLGMPGLTGLEILPVLRTILPHAIIIVLTLLDTEAYRSAAERLGADAYVSKEKLYAELMPTIDRLQPIGGLASTDAEPRMGTQ